MYQRFTRPGVGGAETAKARRRGREMEKVWEQGKWGQTMQGKGERRENGT